MAILSIKILDSVYERYAEHNPGSPVTAMVQQLTRFAEVSPTQRVLIIPPAQRIRLEALMEGSLETADQLVNFVEQLSKVSVGNIHVVLTKPQLARLDDQARFHGKSSGEYLVEQAKWSIEQLIGG